MEEGGGATVTLTQYDLIMQQLIAHDHHDTTASWSSFLAWVILSFFQKFENDIFFTNSSVFPTSFFTIWFVSFLFLFLCAPARSLGTF